MPRFSRNHVLAALRLAGLLSVLCLTPHLLPRAATAREEVWEEELQYEARTEINLKIKNLNAPYEARQKFVQELVELARGKLKPLVMRQLRSAMGTRNDQITEALIEVFARINDPTIIPLFEEELLYSAALDVRLGMILHLPLFCVPQETDRNNIQSFLESGETHLPDNMIAALRSLPLNPANGRYDISLDEDIRGRVESALTWQLDPVEALIMNGLEKRNQDRALLMLKRLLDIDVGHTRNNWLEFWRSRGKTFQSPLQDEILETQINACRMLGFLGAEGTEPLCARLRWLLSTPYDNARQAGMEMLRDCLDSAAAEAPELQKRRADPKLRQPEELWIKRRTASADRLRSLSYELARDYLSDRSEIIRLAMVDALGATRNAAAVEFVSQAMRNDGQSHEMRLHAADALGKIGGAEAELLLEQMAAFKGIAVNRELQVDEFQRVRAAFDALGKIVGRLDGQRLVCTDPAASERAFAFLCGNLADDRTFPGAPPNLPEEEKRVKYLARHQLRLCLQTTENSYESARWQALYRQARSGPQP